MEKKFLVLLIISCSAQADFTIIINQIQNLRKVIESSGHSFSTLETHATQAKKTFEEYNDVDNPQAKIVVLEKVITLLDPIARNYLCTPMTPGSQAIHECCHYTIDLINQDRTRLKKRLCDGYKLNTSHGDYDEYNQLPSSDDASETDSDSDSFDLFDPNPYRLTDCGY